MEQIKTRILINTLIGALCGVVICLVLFGIGAYDSFYDDKPFVILQFIGSMLLGAVCMGASVVYGIDSWGMGKATLTHYVLAMGAFTCASLLLKWFDGITLIIALGIMTIAYAFIWFVNYIIWKREIRNINSDLEKMIREEKEDERP